jgi:hypothetical protein
MKAHRAPIAGLKRAIRGTKERSLKPRSSYPTLSIFPLHRSPLRKLAWIFGFGH